MKTIIDMIINAIDRIGNAAATPMVAESHRIQDSDLTDEDIDFGVEAMG